MKIALIKPPLAGHLPRGTGVYANELTKALNQLENCEIITSTYSKVPSDVDLIHFPYFDPFFLTLPLIRSKKTIVTIHDLIPIRFPQHFPPGLKGQLKWQIQKQAARSCDAIITDSIASQNDIVKFLNVSKTKTHAIYLAAAKEFSQVINKSEKNALTKKYSLPQKFALFVGDANWNKNLPGVIRSAIKVNYPLVIINSLLSQSLPDNAWLKSAQQAQDLIKNAKNITLIPKLEIQELAAFYQMAHMLIYPSFYEGFGLPVLEAFTSKCPVITSHRGSLSEVAGEAALIVNPESETEIAQAIEKISKNEKFRRQLIDKGQLVAQQFNWSTTAEKTYQIYEEMIKS